MPRGSDPLPTALDILGDPYSRLGELVMAESALEKSIWIDPYFTGPYILLGRVELRKGDPSLAARFLE